MPVAFGTLRRYVLHFPPGQSGLAHVQVWYCGRQILPTSLGESFIGDDTLIDLPEAFPIEDPPFELTLVGWAPLATLDHTVYFILYIERDVLLIPAQVEMQVALPEGIV
jgi:hypothetical protein